MAFINDNPPPATVILISGDRDFAYLLSTVRWRKHNVVLISNSSMTHKSLTVQASVAYDWKSDILNARHPPQPMLFRSQTLLSVAALTTPQELEDPPESGVHSVDPLKERVAPVGQPPSVDSETTLIPPKTRTPPRAAWLNTTSDDRIEVNLAGGPTVVCGSAVHTVVVDPVFQQDLVSPNPTDPIGKGGTYPPSSVRMSAEMHRHSAANPSISELSGNGSIKG